jgi:lipopolysaccharide/colanic/teichoic acid biosynthesis glycosyltransferase
MRFLDILFSFCAILFFLPIILVIVIVLRFTGEREVFFLQERIGKTGRTFGLIKFATMLKNSPNIGLGTITMKNDPRILPFGKILRKTKINELPQLFNVLIGQMSLIGPRPLTEKNFNMYSKKTRKIIVQVRPGLSGIGSIIFREEEDLISGSSATIDFYSDVIAPYKGSLEEWFVLNKNVSVYFKSILITLIVIIKPNTDLPWLLFKDLPEPPDLLKDKLNFKKKK